MRAIMEGADETNSPVMLRPLPAHASTRAPIFRHLILAAVEEFTYRGYASPRCVGDVCQRSMQVGFTSVMMDGYCWRIKKHRQIMSTTLL